MKAPEIECRGTWILLRIVQVPGGRKTAGGIHVPDVGATSMEQVGRALVYSAGPDCKRCKPGDVVIVQQGTCYAVLAKDGTQYLLFDEANVAAVDTSWSEQDAMDALTENHAGPSKLVKPKLVTS